jgi:anthranilate/para-aminobenzoate synthase component I
VKSILTEQVKRLALVLIRDQRERNYSPFSALMAMQGYALYSFSNLGC